jgi:hypothetical protein
MGDDLINGWWTAAEALRDHPDLLGVDLVWRQYLPPSADWDHDHCELCWAKVRAASDFSPAEGASDVYSAAYTDDVAQNQAASRATEAGRLLLGQPAGRRRWICSTCADAYRHVFGWHTRGGPGDADPDELRQA